jgi:antitoxin (DNA-binding transcriptional repressor) of toxin-antitoxin stability system
MRSLSVAQAKAQLSALLDAVEHGEDVEITRRGVPVARLVRPNVATEPVFDLAELMANTRAQPLHAGAYATALIRDLGDGARY